LRYLTDSRGTLNYTEWYYQAEILDQVQYDQTESNTHNPQLLGYLERTRTEICIMPTTFSDHVLFH